MDTYLHLIDLGEYWDEEGYMLMHYFIHYASNDVYTLSRGNYIL